MSATFQVEMLWRCGTPDCNQEMLGRYKKCSKCGKPKISVSLASVSLVKEGAR